MPPAHCSSSAGLSAHREQCKRVRSRASSNACAGNLPGFWGCIDAEGRQTNDAAVINGDHILSAYPIDPAKPSKGYGDNTLWIITEADRNVTTLLLPERVLTALTRPRQNIEVKYPYIHLCDF